MVIYTSLFIEISWLATVNVFGRYLGRYNLFYFWGRIPTFHLHVYRFILTCRMSILLAKSRVGWIPIGLQVRSSGRSIKPLEQEHLKDPIVFSQFWLHGGSFSIAHSSISIHLQDRKNVHWNELDTLSTVYFYVSTYLTVLIRISFYLRDIVRAQKVTRVAAT